MNSERAELTDPDSWPSPAHGNPAKKIEKNMKKPNKPK